MKKLQLLCILSAFFIFSTLILSASNETTTQESRRIGDDFRENILSSIRANIAKITFRLFPPLEKKMMRTLDIYALVKERAKLTLWLRIVGPRKVMEQLHSDSGDGSIRDCHQEAHQIGRLSYNVYGSSAFKEFGFFCHSGYYHGAMEAFLIEKGTVDLGNNIYTICNTFETSFGKFECLHGIGHGLLAYVDYDLPDALNFCKSLPDSYSQTSCQGGLFMENIMNGLDRGANAYHKTTWLNEDPHFPCNTLDQDLNTQYQCYQMQTSWMLKLYDYNFDKVVEECLKVPENMLSVCYKSFGRDAAGHTLRNPQKIINLCDKVPKKNDYHNQCIIGAVNVIVDFWGPNLQDQANEFCKLLPRENKGACYNTVTGRLKELFSNPAIKKEICETFEPEYQSLCKN